MKIKKLGIIILFIIGLLLVPIYWLTNIPLLGVIGYIALCLANGFNLWGTLKEWFKGKGKSSQVQ